MLLRILIVVAVLLALLVLAIALRPSAFRITRKASIAAPASALFAEVNDFHRWVAWSPWEKIDPNLKRTYDGPPAGVGASYGWAGNKEIGEGRMTITESRPNDLIRLRLEFLKPFAAVNTTEFTFVPEGDHTVVTQTMTGNYNFAAKAIGMFMNMDKMIGEKFEEGLANLRALVEPQQVKA